jgi:mannosyltransferase
METQAPKEKINAIILVAITLLGLALRLYHLDFQSLWYDELHSIVPTNPENSLASIIEYCKIDQPPAFFIYLYSFFHVFGYNEIIGRLASVILGVISIPVMYSLGREVRGHKAGLFAALLTSLNYMHIYYSQELRFYTMAFLFTALSFLFLIRAFRSNRFLHFAAYVVFTSALLYTHYYGLVIYGVQVLVFIMLSLYSRQRKFIVAGLVSGMLVIGLFLPWIPVVLSDLQIASFWIRMPEPTFIADYFYYYFGKDAIVSAIFIVLIWFFVRGHTTRDNASVDNRAVSMVLIFWLVFSYLIPYIKSLIGPPMLYVRYTIVSLPAWLLIIAIGWDDIKHKRWRLSIVVVVALSMLINLFFIRKHYHKVDKQQFREASAFVDQHNNDQSPLYSRFFWHFNFYFRDKDMKVSDVNTADFAQIQKFWLLQAEFFSPEEKNEVLQRFTDQFDIAERHSFHKTEVLLMKRKAGL